MSWNRSNTIAPLQRGHRILLSLVAISPFLPYRNDAPGTNLVPIPVADRFALIIGWRVAGETSSGKENAGRMAKKRLGELLVETGLLNEEGVSAGLAEQNSKRGELGGGMGPLG